MGAYFIAFSHPLKAFPSSPVTLDTPPFIPAARSFGSSTAAARKNAVGCWITTRTLPPTAAALKLPANLAIPFHIILSLLTTMPFWISSMRLDQYVCACSPAFCSSRLLMLCPVVAPSSSRNL